MGKKSDTLELLFEQCQQTGSYEFDNDQVKRACRKTGFKNPFDVTKADHSVKLPEVVRQAGYCVVHLGEGRHCFLKALDIWYHRLEAISENEQHIWKYQPSLLNATDDSESNIISLTYNQKIIQDFLYSDITANPKIYMSRRTKISTSYSVGGMCQVEATKLQVEMDATFEHNGEVTVVEGKNSFPGDFAVYQLFHPFLDYHGKGIPGIKKVECCYLVREQNTEGSHVIRLYLYNFKDVKDIASLSLLKKAEYVLERRDS